MNTEVLADSILVRSVSTDDLTRDPNNTLDQKAAEAILVKMGQIVTPHTVDFPAWTILLDGRLTVRSMNYGQYHSVISRYETPPMCVADLNMDQCLIVNLPQLISILSH